MLDRRSVLKAIGTGTAAAGAAGMGNAILDGGPTQVSGPVPIGVILPLSGDSQPFGRPALRGFATYFGYRGASQPDQLSTGRTEFTIDDTTYALEIRDSEGDKQLAAQKAEELSDDASVIFGGALSDSAEAIANRVPEQVPYVTGPASSVDITHSSTTCSRSLFRTMETPAMDAITGATYLATGRDDVDSVYVYASNTSRSETVRQQYSRVLEANGVTIAGTRTISVTDDPDWDSELQAAVDANVDAVLGLVPFFMFVDMVSAQLSGGYSFRTMAAWRLKIGMDLLGSALQNQLDSYSAEAIEQAGIGPFSCRYHWNQYDNDVATAMNETHRQVYRLNPDVDTSSMFTAASAIVQAVEDGGSLESSDIISQLRGMTVRETPKGTGAYEFQTHNNQAKSPMTVAGLAPGGDTDNWDGELRAEPPTQSYGKDETVVQSGDVECSLTLRGTPSGTTSQTTQQPTQTPPSATPEPATETPTETAEPSDDSGGVTISGGDGDDDGAAGVTISGGDGDGDGTTAGDSGPLGPGVGIAGIAGGLGAAWLANRDGSDDEE